MKNMLTKIVDAETIRSFATATGKFIDTHIQSDRFSICSFLTPQWFAGSMGLKKLIEKDYHAEDEPYFLAPTNV